MWATLHIARTMAGPLIERLAQRFSSGKDEVQRIRETSPILEQHREELREEMAKEGGGCCGAFTAAKAVRSDEQEYR